jgi:hypothetical protein
MENKSMNTNQEHHKGISHEELVKFFEQQQSILQKIQDQGFSSYVESISNLGDAFKENKRSVCCMDEGTPGGCFHTAGSGILRNRDEVLKYYREAGVEEITSHDGCGAAGLYAKAHGLDSTKADEYGKEWSKGIAQELGIAYRHINSKEMSRPEGQHIARVAYYDTTGRFDYSKSKELPIGFTISRGIQSVKDAIDDALIAFTIGTGGHGFDKLITEKDPFIVSVIANDEDELKQLKSELSGFEQSLGKKIKIDGFVAPVLK